MGRIDLSTVHEGHIFLILAEICFILFHPLLLYVATDMLLSQVLVAGMTLYS
jgi:hypothetical protein